MKIDRATNYIDVSKVYPILGGKSGSKILLKRSIEKLLGVEEVNRRLSMADGENWEKSMVKLFEVNMSVQGANPVSNKRQVWLANHPLGGLDALAMMLIAVKDRDDVMVLANELLAEIPWWKKYLAGVDILNKNATAKNADTFKKVIRHLKQGGRLVVFPAGRVACRYEANEGVWIDHFIKMARKYEAEIVPIGISGNNPAWFHFLGSIHPVLKMSFLLRAMLSKLGSKITFNFGETIILKDDGKSDQMIANELREHSLRLAGYK